MTPRSFLLSQVPLVAKHALLLVHWEHDGAALLSIPTREYLQCSIWTDAAPPPPPDPPAPSEMPSAPMPVAGDVRPGTQHSLGSADPRYREFDTMSSHPGHHKPANFENSRALPADWSNEREATANASSSAAAAPIGMVMLSSSPPSGDVMDHHIDASAHHEHMDAPGFATFDYGFADAFGSVTPDSTWDYRANRSAVVYDSGDESETDFDANAAGAGAGPARGRRTHEGLELQTDVTRLGMGGGPSGVIISEGVALSPSDVDSDMDGNAAALASRFVMEERMRRVYGPLEGDLAESDELDLTSLDLQHEDDDVGGDSDATEDGQPQQPGGRPTRVGKLKKEKMRLQEEQEAERARIEQEELEFGAAGAAAPDRDESFSIRSQSPPAPPKPLPPMPPGAVEAWQAGLLFALTR